MLEPPKLPTAHLVAALRAHYAVDAARADFLPLGADPDSAVYRVATGDGRPYFLKLRHGAFAAAPLAVPRLLRDAGVTPILAPLPTTTGTLWVGIGDFTAALFPYIDGRNGFDAPLSACQWRRFGAALRAAHTTTAPGWLRALLRAEEYAPIWREQLRDFLARAERDSYADPVARRLGAFLIANAAIVTELVGRAERLASVLQARPLTPVLCHADIHAGNVLLASDGALSIVDWDTTMLAPKERDLMFIGAGIGDVWRAAREVEHFYAGYGPAEVDQTALAYYRCERIVEDLAVFCQQLLLTNEGGADREAALGFVTGSFQPNGVVDIALKTGAAELV